ncbi:MAG: S46 family peptidase, partial [Bacteroidia bacterium]
MMNRRILSILLAGVLASGNMMAQGMWIPSKAKTENFDEMKEFGLQLSPDQLYSTENGSLKDAIIRLKGGMCSAEFISSQGLVLTNHHCGYDGVASLSSIEHDYLTNGFWAYSKEQELSIPDYFVSLLVRIEDVTDQVLGSDRDEKNPQVIQERLQGIITKASEGGKYKVDPKPMFAGNEYFIYVYEDYKDVRLVGAPPSSIGKYGGDTDNWMWPRHTGDFTMLRVYAKADGSASEGYDKANVPFKPKQYLPVSMKGVGEGDYAMIMGYPGSTDRYLTSDQIQFAMDYSNGSKIDAMGKRLEIMKKYMDKNDTIRIAVASSYASGMNGWKYYIGQNTMLKRYDIPGKKRQEEKDFTKWAVAKGDTTYTKVVSKIGGLYSKDYAEIDRFINYVFYGLMPAASLNLGRDFARMKTSMEKDPTSKDVAKKGVENIKKRLPEWQKEYFPAMDKDIVTALLIAVKKEVKGDLLPPVINEILASKAAKKGKTDEEKFRMWVNNAFATSVVTNKAVREKFFAMPDVKVLQNDPIVTLANGVVAHFRDKLAPRFYGVQGLSEELAKDYIAGLRLANPGKNFYPDANST